MKAIHYFFVAIIALAMGYAGNFLAPQKEVVQVKKETAYERVMRTGVLRCGYAMWPPLVMNKDPNTGELSGVGKDIIEAAAKNLSLKVEWTEESGWGNYPTALNSGRFDVFCAIAGQSAAKGRETRYTVPLFYAPVYAYVRTDETRINEALSNLDDAAFRISGQDGEVSELIAHNYFPKAIYVGQQQLSELGQIFMNVATGKADIVFNAPDVAEDFMSKNPDKLKRLSAKPFQTYSLTYAVAMNEENLQQMLDSALIELHNNGLIEKILNTHDAKADQFLRVMQPYQTAAQ
jgi:ABC-type amino acid transport substrate-binding protein